MSRGTTTRLVVFVQPNARQTEVVCKWQDGIKIRVAEKPEKGKANKELIAFIAKKLGIPRSNIKLVSGGSSRKKVVSIEGLTLQEVFEKLGL